MIRKYINAELSKIEKQLKLNIDKKDNISLKNQLLDMMYLIDIYEKYKLQKKKIEKIITLPTIYTCAAEYRIINDCESDNKEYWQEMEIDNETIRLHSDDIIIKMK